MSKGAARQASEQQQEAVKRGAGRQSTQAHLLQTSRGIDSEAHCRTHLYLGCLPARYSSMSFRSWSSGTARDSTSSCSTLRAAASMRSRASCGERGGVGVGGVRDMRTRRPEVMVARERRRHEGEIGSRPKCECQVTFRTQTPAQPSDQPLPSTPPAPPSPAPSSSTVIRYISPTPIINPAHTSLTLHLHHQPPPSP